MELDDDSDASAPAIWLNLDGILLDAREIDFDMADRLQDLGGVAPNIPIPAGEIIDLTSIGHVSTSSQSSLSLNSGDSESMDTSSDVSSSQRSDVAMTTNDNIERNDDVTSNQSNKFRRNAYYKSEFPDLYGSSDNSSQESKEGDKEEDQEGHGDNVEKMYDTDEVQENNDKNEEGKDEADDQQRDEEGKEEADDQEGDMVGEEEAHDQEGWGEESDDQEGDELGEEKADEEGKEEADDQVGDMEGEEEAHDQEGWGEEGDKEAYDQDGDEHGEEKADDKEGDKQGEGGADDQEGNEGGEDDVLNNDGDDEWEMISGIPVAVNKSTVDKVSGMGRELGASIEFFNTMGMEQFYDLQSKFVTMDVKPDGNCLFYAIMMGLFHQRIDPFYHQTGSNIEKLLHLKKQLSAITDFRRQMFMSLLDNCPQFNSKDHNIRSVHNSLGQRWQYYSGDANNLIFKKDRPAAVLFNDTVDFSQGCGRSHWGDVPQHLPLAAYTHKISIIVYSTMQYRRGSDPPIQERKTDFAHYSMGNVHMHTLITGWYTPPPSVDCITLQRVADCHFQYLRPNQMTTIVPHDFGVRFKTYQDNSSKSSCADDEAIFESKSTQGRVVTNPYKKSTADHPVNHDGDTGADGSDTMFPANDQKSNADHPLKQDGGTGTGVYWSDTIGSANDQVSASRPTGSALQHVRKASRLLGGKGDMSLFPHYRDEVVIDGSKHYRYTLLESEMFTTTVRAIDLAGMVVAAHDGTSLTMACVVPASRSNFGAFFRSEIQKAPDFPEHIAIRGGRVGETTFGKEGRGKRPKHKYIVYVSGSCMGTPKNKCDEVPTRCTTRWVGGINAKNLLLYAKRPTDSIIEMSISISGSCVHDKNKIYGQIRGVERAEAVREVK